MALLILIVLYCVPGFSFQCFQSIDNDLPGISFERLRDKELNVTGIHLFKTKAVIPAYPFVPKIRSLNLCPGKAFVTTDGLESFEGFRQICHHLAEEKNSMNWICVSNIAIEDDDAFFELLVSIVNSHGKDKPCLVLEVCFVSGSLLQKAMKDCKVKLHLVDCTIIAP